MKKIYWQPHYISKAIMVCLCAFAVTSLIAVEHFKKNIPQNYYNQKLSAVTLTNQALILVKNVRLKKHIAINPQIDPQRSGLIGIEDSRVTTDHGSLRAKQTTINPNLAAIFIPWLKSLGVKSGDTVAIGMTGSYPALNIALLSAIQTLKLKPIIIASLGSSQWGANIPNLLWLDMYEPLKESGLIPFSIAAASLGGIDDNAKGKSAATKQLMLNTIKRYKIPLLAPKNVQDSIAQRMQLYQQQAAGTKIKVYINLGGGTASVGRYQNKRRRLPNGIIRSLPVIVANDDSVILRFLKQGTPVINLKSITGIARKHGLPIAPKFHPRLAQGQPFFKQRYNDYLASACLGLIILLLVVTAIINRAIFYKQNDINMDPPSV